MQSQNLRKIMVNVAQCRSLPDALSAIVGGLAQCTDVVLSRIWLIAPGDICANCRFRPECPDQSHCLHLVASAGNPGQTGRNYANLNGAFRRFPLGVRKIGRIAQSGEPLLIPGLRGDEDWIAEPQWMKSEGVRTFAGQPLVYRGEVLGVLAIFDRGVLGEDDFEWLRVFADHAAVTISNARSFEEIQRLKSDLEAQNEYLWDQVRSDRNFGSIVGQSPGLQKVMHQIELVAPTDAAVLVTGESGTGKELVALAIHEHSPRKSRSLIKVNCSAIPDSLFESEFFGHVRGAFTGAVKDKPGRFELADGGTLFLDEIGEVPLAMQAKLLRVLQEQEIERVGDTRVRKVNVRIIAATNRDLMKEAQAGRFRQDLFYRLSVFPIQNPPLRERRDDIPLLAAHFVRQCARRMNRPEPRLTKATISQLVAYDWPGNVRELQNAVERALILAVGDTIRFDLPTVAEIPRYIARPRQASDRRLVTREDLKRREKESIIAALAQSAGRIFGPDGAAELLGMKPTTLASRIKALGIKRKPND